MNSMITTHAIRFLNSIGAELKTLISQAGRGRRPLPDAVSFSPQPVYIAVAVGLTSVALAAIPARVCAVDEPPNHTISLTIERVKQIHNVDDTRSGEFYAKVKMHQQSFPKTGHREDDGDVSPHWTFITVAPENLTLWIYIAIYDHDWPDPDDHCDASPVKGGKTLRISYNVRTEEIRGDVTGHGGDLIHTRGAGDGNRVEIWFRITRA